MAPKVSIVIPCCNVEKYVEQCVRSAMEQTLDDIEIICVNDGSTDSTLSILQSLAREDERISIIDKPNTGYGNSMNVGFDAAHGDYLAILESDDFIDADMIETHYAIAVEHDLDAVKSNFYFYWSVPEERNVHCDLLDEEECGRVLNPREEPHIFYVKPSIWSAIYRTEFIRSNNIRFNETPGASFQDTSFNFQVWLYSKRVYFIHNAYLHYRQDNESSSVKAQNKIYCVCDEYMLMEHYASLIVDNAERAAIMSMIVKMKYDTYMWNYERLEESSAKEFMFRFSEEMKSHIDRGDIDWSLFERDKARELRMLVDCPTFAHVRRQSLLSKEGTARRVLSYFRAGGLKYVLMPRKY